MTYYSYHFVCAMIDKYEYLYQNATSLKQREIAGEALQLYRGMYKAFSN